MAVINRSMSMTATAGDGRVEWIDYAKGWCIVLVVMMHSTLGVGDALGGEGFLHQIVAWARPFRMPDFFLIAGVMLTRSIDLDWRRFLDRKVLYFLYFFTIWTVIQLLMKKGCVLLFMPDVFFANLAFAFVEPFGTLWFIYLLPVMFVVVKLLRHAPAWLVLAASACAEIAIHATGWQSGYVMIDEFLARFIYFYSGFRFAPLVFRFADAVGGNARLTLAALFGWAALETLLIALPASTAPALMTPTQLAGDAAANLSMLPVVSLIAGFAGAFAVIAFSRLLADAGALRALRYCGRHSLVIYLSFFVPMALTRTLLVELGMNGVGLKSLIVTVVAIAAPLAFHALTRATPLRFLFVRPAFLTLRDPRWTLTPRRERRLGDGRLAGKKI